MKTIESWLKEVKSLTLSTRWHAANNTNWDEASTARLLNEAPASLFGSIVSLNQSEAIAYWLDVCCQLSAFHQRSGNVDLAFQYQQFSYSKIQVLATVPNQDPAMRRWCIKKLECMVVDMLEFCQHQPHPPDWQKIRKHLIDTHVHFMQQLSHQNLSFGPVIKIPH
ncbi:hypothetical protein LRP52_02120 [Photobacterium sp. ZSDE20]|uniref:Transcriptional regulator n=1 Tax=Photobacterium pectinilyticum TaxID=2906793 RepID=A0ABT1MWK1_9GAMM|nr:hypothetical protein [Photobacterium sp. ZSDE20]MCQ1056866.1 hypothetical protein [Photobacterium sp. ZSDE20]MDD1821001.1 hypothetical protein [Photobacterium sp. ZSDE20]